MSDPVNSNSLASNGSMLLLDPLTQKQRTGWDASTENTDTRDVETLVQQPESNDDYTSTDIHVPDLFKSPRKVQRLKNELHKKFNINVVTEGPEGCDKDEVIRVEGYGIDQDTLLSTVQRYDARATVLH